MQTASRETKSIRFDVFEVDLVARELIKQNRRVRLQDLPYRLLVALLERAGETVTREELRGKLWGDAAVEFDCGLHTAVRKLRDVLGDSATNPRFIETVPRRGYRFIAAVSTVFGTTDGMEADISSAGTAQLPVVPGEPVNVQDSRELSGPGSSPSHISAATVYLCVCTAFVVIAVVSLTVFTQRSATQELRSFADSGEAVPIVTERGSERSPALSPDGARVVFSWSGESGENLNLYVQNIDGSGRVRLTGDQGPDRFPKWSPDGRTIAFLRAGELLSMPAIGGPQRRITTAAGDGLSWSPDSRTLAVSDRESNDESLSVYLVSEATGKRDRLTFPAASKQQDVWPTFSAKGDRVAFVRRTTTTDDVFHVPATGGKPTRLALPGRPLHGLAWTPDGSFVLAATGRQAPGLLVVPADAHDQTRIKRLDIAGSDVYEPSVVARNGSPKMDLAFGHETSNWDILGMPIQGSAITPTPLIASIRNDQAPSYSPDGKWLAFNSARSGYEEIWISRADGSESRQVTHFNSGLASSPRWSPDGQRIAFDGTIDSNRDIYVVRGDGGVPQRMTREPSSEGQPSWSHDGRWIYFMSDRSGSQQIWKMPAGGGASVQLTYQGGYQALEAPDGKSLYYAKRRRGAGLWRVSVNGGGESLVSDTVWQNLWSIAGDYIFYFDLGGLVPGIFDAPHSVPVKRLNPGDGQTTTVATILTDLPAGVPALEVRPDGKYLAWVTRREHTSEIMLIRGLSISVR